MFSVHEIQFFLFFFSIETMECRYRYVKVSYVNCMFEYYGMYINRFHTWFHFHQAWDANTGESSDKPWPVWAWGLALVLVLLPLMWIPIVPIAK